MLATALFYAPVAATCIHPIFGLTVATGFVVWHFRYQPFKRALDQLDANYRPPIPFDPMELIFDTRATHFVNTFKPENRHSGTPPHSQSSPPRQ